LRNMNLALSLSSWAPLMKLVWLKLPIHRRTCGLNNVRLLGKCLGFFWIKRSEVSSGETFLVLGTSHFGGKAWRLN
jgi:hypothetical protein